MLPGVIVRAFQQSLHAVTCEIRPSVQDDVWFICAQFQSKTGTVQALLEYVVV